MIVPLATPAMLTATAPATEIGVQGESAACTMQRFVNWVPVSLLVGPLPLSELFDWAMSELAVTIV